MFIIKVGEKLKNIRKEKNISARELSRRSGISQSYLSQLETGKNDNPTNETLKKLSLGLNIPHDHLMVLLGYVNPKTYSTIKNIEAEAEEIRKVISEMVQKNGGVLSPEIKQEMNNMFSKLEIEYGEKLGLQPSNKEKVDLVNFLDNPIYEVFYKNKKVSKSDKKDIMKFIENFVINKDGD